MQYHLFFQQHYKLDTLLLKQKNLPVFDITGFLFRMSTQVKAEVPGLHLSTHAEKETRYIQYGPPRPSPEYSCGKRNPLYPIRAASFVSIVLYIILIIKSGQTRMTPYPPSGELLNEFVNSKIELLQLA